jgi:AraC family transcriptional regulator
MDIERNAGFTGVACAHLPVDSNLEEAGDTVQVPLHKLQSAVADITRALNEALRDECTSAVLYLQRAANFLRPAEQPQQLRGANSGPRLTAWQRRRVLEHIENHFAKPLKNRELAALVDFSEFHFSVAFRNSLGTPPHEFLIRRRIERARQLMLSTDMPLCEIAAECGLADQAHLSRLFRRIVGETPAAWRRNRFTERSGSSGGAARRSATR